MTTDGHTGKTIVQQISTQSIHRMTQNRTQLNFFNVNIENYVNYTYLSAALDSFSRLSSPEPRFLDRNNMQGCIKFPSPPPGGGGIESSFLGRKSSGEEG